MHKILALILKTYKPTILNKQDNSKNKLMSL
jgi:hypothetical protein